MRRAIASGAGVLILVALAVTTVGAQERFGALSGVVLDSTGSVLPGATVTVTNLDNETFRVVTTGSDGLYRVPALEPGRYSVVIELDGFSPSEYPEVTLLVGRPLLIDATLELGALAAQVVVTAPAPTIDIRGTVVANNVSSEEIDRLPKTRSFQRLALTAPRVNAGEIEGGFQVNGASGAENNFIVDGISTSSLINGSSRQNTVFEYVQEVQVKTAGIQAQYGGALGGVISAITKSGGNIFTGEAHYYYSGNGLSSSPVQRLVLDPVDEATVNYFQDPKQTDNRNEVGGSVGGPIVRDRLFFFGSFSPRRVNRTNDYLFSNGTEPGSIDSERTEWSAFGKISYAGRNIKASYGLLTTPTRSLGRLPAYDGGPTVLSSTLASNDANKVRGYEVDQIAHSGTFDLILWNDALFSVRGAYFRDNYQDVGIPEMSSVTYRSSAIDLPFDVPAGIEGPVGTQNTPRASNNFMDETLRKYVDLSYVQTRRFLGEHNLKAGFGVQRTVNDVDNRYPGGGYVYVWWDQAFTSNATGLTDRGEYGYYEVNDVATRGTAGGDIYSLYIQDQWVVHPQLTLSLGLRTENETIPSFRPDLKAEAIKFGFGDKMAPRVGASFDVRGNGQTKVYVSWGRYFDWTKYELARGAFGADVWQIRYRALDTTDVFSLSGTNAPGRNLWSADPDSFRDRRVPNFDSVDPDLKPMSQDSLNIGFEHQLAPRTTFRVDYVRNTLNRTIEDVGVLFEGDETYFYANPGEGIARETFTTGLTDPFPTPRARRDYNAVSFSIDRRFSNNWFGSASYVYSRLYGNYAGLANSDEISTPTTGRSSPTAQQDAGSIARPGSNVTRTWDLDELLWDANGNLDVLGRLATDRPHAVKFHGSYSLNNGTQVGLFFLGASGTPVSTVVNTINQIPVFANGRGDLGRTSMLTQTDLLLAHDIRLEGSRRVRLELNVINLFNQKTQRHVFDRLNRERRQSSAVTLGGIDLANGYDYNALIAASPEGDFAYDPRYGMSDLFNPGLQGRFLLKYLF